MFKEKRTMRFSLFQWVTTCHWRNHQPVHNKFCEHGYVQESLKMLLRQIGSSHLASGCVFVEGVWWEFIFMLSMQVILCNAWIAEDQFFSQNRNHVTQPLPSDSNIYSEHTLAFIFLQASRPCLLWLVMGLMACWWVARFAQWDPDLSP